MRHARGELADRHHFLLLHQLSAQALQDARLVVKKEQEVVEALAELGELVRARHAIDAAIATLLDLETRSEPTRFGMRDRGDVPAALQRVAAYRAVAVLAVENLSAGDEIGILEARAGARVVDMGFDDFRKLPGHGRDPRLMSAHECPDDDGGESGYPGSQEGQDQVPVADRQIGVGDAHEHLAAPRMWPRP